MKKTLSILLLCVMLLASTAMADCMPPGAQLIEFERTQTIDGDNWPVGQTPVSYEVNTGIYGFLPLPDGGKVLSGDVEYPGQYRDAYKSSYANPEDMRRNEAYALCLEPDGTVRWELRLADPQADNSFGLYGLLPDGRILLCFHVYDTSFGPKYFLVRQDGFVESMLEHRMLSEAFTPLSLMLMPNGYLGGDSTAVDDHYDSYYDMWAVSIDERDRHMTLLDFDLNPIWTLDMAPYTGKAMNQDALGLRDGTLVYGNSSHTDDAGPQAFAMKVRPDGSVAWQYNGGETDYAFIGDAAETDDGVLLVENSYGPEGDLPCISRLIALSSEGEVRFTVDLDKEEALTGMDYFGRIVPLGDGFVLRGSTQTRDETLLAHLDTQGTLMGTLRLSSEADRTAWYGLTAGADGKTYVSGMVTELRDETTGRTGDSIGFFYAELLPESFD